MKAICTDETVIDCANFKAVDSGVVLTADEEREEVIGFVPRERLVYLLPDELARQRGLVTEPQPEQMQAAGQAPGVPGARASQPMQPAPQPTVPPQSVGQQPPQQIGQPQQPQFGQQPPQVGRPQPQFGQQPQPQSGQQQFGGPQQWGQQPQQFGGPQQWGQQPSPFAPQQFPPAVEPFGQQQGRGPGFGPQRGRAGMGQPMLGPY